MTEMVKRHLGIAAGLLVLASWSPAQNPRALQHRVWLLGRVPDETTLTALRSGGVDGLVLPVGQVQLLDGSSRFTLTPLPDLGALAGWSVTPLVWVEAGGTASGDPTSFSSQVAPVQRMFKGGAALLLASTRYAPGLVSFATAVARKLGQTVELALPAQDIVQHLPKGGWKEIRAVAVTFGNPSALGFPQTTLQDDLVALDGLDAALVAYRGAIVVAPRSTPAPGPAGVSLASIVGGQTSIYRPGERGDVFQLHKAVDWGGVTVEAGQSIAVELVDTARYHRDLGLLLRPVRPLLMGWDTVGLPAPEPNLGMSREAFLAYLRGGEPHPRPQVVIGWPEATVMRVSVANPTPQASALSTTGNWVELRLEGTEVRDVQLGDFAGMEYGRLTGGVWHRTAARDASSLRLYLTFVPPQARVTGCVVTFLTRPRSVASRWSVRLGDGGDGSGPLPAVPLTTR
jgi:hypothetical protein